jgi:hypothetical protein
MGLAKQIMGPIMRPLANNQLFTPTPREQIKRATLESAIATAVKSSDPSCQAFVGVFVERATPKSGVDTNWTLKGVKFGRAERESSNAALTVIVERLKREFEISD